jgi:hypothetical protein
MIGQLINKNFEYNLQNKPKKVLMQSLSCARNLWPALFGFSQPIMQATYRRPGVELVKEKTNFKGIKCKKMQIKIFPAQH